MQLRVGTYRVYTGPSHDAVSSAFVIITAAAIAEADAVTLPSSAGRRCAGPCRYDGPLQRQHTDEMSRYSRCTWIRRALTAINISMR